MYGEVRDSGEKRSQVDWARFWFAQLAKHHRVHDPAKWAFTEEDVIAFLRSKLKAGMPAWKRVMIVKGLIVYRNQFLRSKDPKLEPIRAKLQQIAADERRKHEGIHSIEEVVGKINPNEPDLIQELRRTLRKQGKSPNTEKAYVKWVKRFMKARCVETLAEFADLDATDVESFLTDLAVDGGVAASLASSSLSTSGSGGTSAGGGSGGSLKTTVFTQAPRVIG